MSQKTIKIKTVTAPSFKDGIAILTPQLTLDVSYTTGGLCYFTGSRAQRGYEISIKHDRRSDQGFTSFLIDGKGNPTATVEPAKRFSIKTLERIANDVRAGKHDELIAALYAKAVYNRSEYVWPESILPLDQTDLIPSDGFADGGEAYTSEELAAS